MRSFNTTGPVVAEDHYCIPPLDRFDLECVLDLIHHQRYFFLHAPHQTGQTSALAALANLLNSGTVGNYRCLHANIEAAQIWGEDIDQAMSAILKTLADAASRELHDESLHEIRSEVLANRSSALWFQVAMHRWTRADPRPLVLLIEGADALVGYSLLSLLRQVRTGHMDRPTSFPHSIALCGVRNVRNIRFRPGPTGEPLGGGSPFSFASVSLRLADFTRAEVETLLGQHTAETGQEFEPAARDRLWTQTVGQPWLVNALCSHACFESPRGRDRSRPITDDDILEAQETLLQGPVEHLDRFATALREERVQQVIEPLLSRTMLGCYELPDLEYVQDIGLVAQDPPTRIANPIYAELVPRALTFEAQQDLHLDGTRYTDQDGELNPSKLVAAFQEYYRENSEHWLQRFQYREAGPQLLLQAFLQRAVKGVGRIEREYAMDWLGTELLVVWPRSGRTSKFVVECRILRDSLEWTLGKGLPQIADCMDRCNAEEGHLVIFDRDGKPWSKKAFRRSESFNGKRIEVWGV